MNSRESVIGGRPAQRLRPAAFFDMNGTLMRGEPGWVLLQLLHERGNCSDAQMALMMENMARYRRHELSNEVTAENMYALLRTVLPGLSVAEVMGEYKHRHDHLIRPSIFPYSRDLVALLHKRGCDSYTITNVPRPPLDLLTADIGIRKALAPEFEINDGRFSGAMRNWHGAGQVKGKAVQLAAKEDGIDLAASYGFGDGEGDASYLELVGHPVAVNPTPKLREIAEERGWPIVEQTENLHEVTAAIGAQR